MEPARLVEIWRGPFVESVHLGHAVIAAPSGEIREVWGDPDAVILPRSSAKMIQALPLVEGYGDTLSTAQLALACASHQGAARHVAGVEAWLSEMQLGADDLVCGPQMPRAPEERHCVLCAHHPVSRLHNNCSGKHAGFLMLAQKLGADLDYHHIDHPVQELVRACFEDLAGTSGLGHGIDGCSAPNYATTVAGLARAVARFAGREAGVRGAAMTRLREAMMAEPYLVAGEGRACTQLMEATGRRAAVKTGAEGVFVAICPQQELGIAVKITDGATRAAEAVIAALLAKVGVLEADHPVLQQYTYGPIRNWDGLETGKYVVMV